MKITGRLTEASLDLVNQALCDHDCNITAKAGSSHIVGTTTVKFHSEGYGAWYMFGGYFMQWAMIQATSLEDAYYVYLEEFVAADEMPGYTPEGCVSGKLAIELYSNDGEAVDTIFDAHDDQPVPAITPDMVPKIQEDSYDLVIEFLSSGYHGEGKNCGPPENCCPPGGGKERVPSRAYLIHHTTQPLGGLQKEEIELSYKEMEKLFDHFQTRIEEVELEQPRYEEYQRELENGTFDGNGDWYSELTTSYVVSLDWTNYDEWDIDITPKN